MSPAAVLVGRTGSDIVNNVLSLGVMSATGLLVGWRIRTSVPEAVVGFLLILAVRLRHLLGDDLRRAGRPDARGRQQRLVHVHLPADVHRQHVRAVREPAGVLRAFAEWNPVSAVTQAARELFGNGPAATGGAWSLEHPVAYGLSGSGSSWRCSCRCRSANTSRPRTSRSHRFGASSVEVLWGRQAEPRGRGILGHAVHDRPQRRRQAVRPPVRGAAPPPGLAVGAMAPDFEYLVHLSATRTIGHTIPGLFVLCLPSALLVLFLWHRLVGPVLAPCCGREPAG